MPFYDYECDACTAVFEVFHGINDTCCECEDCHSSDIHLTYKNINAPEVLVKGAWMAPEFMYDSETTYEPTRYGRKSWDKPKRGKLFPVS